MKIRKRRTGNYRIDLTKDELTHLSEVLKEHSAGHSNEQTTGRSWMWGCVMDLAVKFPGVHTVKEDTTA